MEKFIKGGFIVVKKSLTILLFFFLFINVEVNAQNLEKQEWLIVFDSKRSVSKFEFETEDLQVVKRFPSLSMLLVNMSKEKKEEIEKKASIVHMEKNEAIQFHKPNVANIKKEYDETVKRLDLDILTLNRYSGKGIKVGVIDTGIANHPDLHVAGGVSFVSMDRSLHIDQDGHGTHVSGIIAAMDNDFGVTGVAPDSELYSIKVMNGDLKGTSSSVIEGIEWAIQHELDIVNLSLGWQEYVEMFDIVFKRAYDNGLLMVAATGNDGMSQVHFPASFESVIGVGAIDFDQGYAHFSNNGEALEFSGYGVDVYSTYLDEQYVYMSGTSMASPYITGILALYMEANPHLTNKEIRELARMNAVNLGAPGKDNFFGYGVLSLPIPIIHALEKPQIETIVTDETTIIAGRTDPNNRVVLQEVTGKKKVHLSDETGHFTFKIKKRRVGETFDVYVENEDGQKSERLTVTVLESNNWVLWKKQKVYDDQKVWHIRFNAMMDESTLTKENIYILDGNDGVVAIDIAIDRDKEGLKLSPISRYDPEEVYTLYIDKGIKNKKGMPIKEKIKFEFNIEKARF